MRHAACLVLILVSTRLLAADWPQFLGPDRNGASTETNLQIWPKEGPRERWKADVGAGWSGPVVASDRLVVFHRVNDEEVVQCLSATTGAAIWTARYPTGYRDDFGFDAGPRATPAIADKRVFTYGAEGILNAWSLENGTNLWRLDTRKKFGAAKGFFGIACSPLVDENAAILNVGGESGAGIVAIDVKSGKLLWKATDQQASYSSPAATTFGGRRRVFVLARDGLVSLNPENGNVWWQFPFRPRSEASVTAAVPLIIGDMIFISASYGAGATLLRFGQTRPEVIWERDDVMSNHYSTSIHHDGMLYGFDGRQEQRCHLRCIDLKNGIIRWSEDRFGAGNLIRAGNKLLIVSERGELIMVLATPKGFTPLARTQILGADCRANPALSGGLLFARDKSKLVCIDLNPLK